MTPHRHVLWLFLVVILLSPLGAVPGEAASRVLKLRSAGPAQLADIIRQTFHPRVRVAEAPMINGLVLAADNEDLLDQVEALVRELDRPPATLRFAVRMLSEEEERAFRVRLRDGQSFLPEIAGTRRSGGETRTVVGMENAQLNLTDESTRTEVLNGPWGPQPYTITERRGVRISGHLSGPDAAVVSLWYAEGPNEQSHQLISQVRAPLGQWVFVGAADRDGGDRSTGWSVNSRGEASLGTNKVTGLRSYLVCVECVSGGPNGP